MDDNTAQPADSPAPSPAKGRGFASRRGVTSGRGGVTKRGRGRGGRGRGGGRGKGRGRHKTYDDARVQAAYERQKELRELYSEVASAVKPALEKVADYNINQMIEDPHAHEDVEEFHIIQKQLDDRLAATIASVRGVSEQRRATTNTQFNLHNEISRKKFQDGFNYATEEFLDGASNRIGILCELRREDAGISVPDFRFEYVEESDEVANDQGPYVFRKGPIEVPYPHLLGDGAKVAALRSTLRKPQAAPNSKPAAGPKRKADEVTDGQPESKRLLAASLGATTRQASGEEASTPRPRHIGGLLSAETELEAEPESNAPSPTPLDEDQSPASDQKESTSKKDLPDLPAGASEPDTHGVRTVFRRGPRSNNRIVIPCQFEFDDDDIGFRDSTNDSSRKATRASRGRFLNKPNSRYWHLDQTIDYYNCLEYQDGDLDPEVVERHKLHPKYGFFLPDSVNESESPSEHDYGVRPVVLVTPSGNTLQASRSVRSMFMDQSLEADSRKSRIASALEYFCEQGEVSVDDITTEEMRERDRQALERLTSESEHEEESLRLPVEPEPLTLKEEAQAAEGIGRLLEAASTVEQAERPSRPVSSTPQRSSRPYDAVRDVFGTSEAIPVPVPPQVDTFGLSVLADIAESPDIYRGQPEASFVDSSAMIDPRLLNGPRPGPSGSSNSFLQTALNPTPGFAHIAPAPPVNAGHADPRSHTPASRNPFTGQGIGKISPALPPLRPAKRDKPAAAPSTIGLETQQDPRAPGGPPLPLANTQTPQMMQSAPVPPPAQVSQEFGSPRGMLQTNTGNFYPPAPHRSYHHSFSIHEPGHLMSMSMQQVPPLMPGPSMLHTQPPPLTMSPYPAISPPMPGHAQLAPMGPQMGASPPLAPPGAPSPMAGSPPSSAGQRQRGSSNGQNANNNKYRRIAAAPIPHNRPWAQNGGSELRLSNYDPKGSIKDYTANEPPPRSGPTTIRGWSVNNVNKSRGRGMKKEGSAEDTGSPK